MSAHNAQGDAETSQLQMIATVGADQAKGGWQAVEWLWLGNYINKSYKESLY